METPFLKRRRAAEGEADSPASYDLGKARIEAGVHCAFQSGLQPAPVAHNLDQVIGLVDNPVDRVSSRANVANFTRKCERFETALFEKTFIPIRHVVQREGIKFQLAGQTMRSHGIVFKCSAAELKNRTSNRNFLPP
jgi:hypothetical protein